MKKYKRFRLIVLILGVNYVLAACGENNSTGITTTVNQSPLPPSQPASGPGGTTYQFNSVKQTSYSLNENRYTIFEPADPTPKSAPVILFLHGFEAIDSRFYYGWITHLVRRGNIVIYPAYQQPLSGFDVFLPSAVKALGEAVSELKSGRHVSPELDTLMVVGHSLGGVLTGSIAATAARYPAGPIPVPKALMLVEPGGLCEAVCLRSLSQIEPETKMLVLVGDRDTNVGDATAKSIWQATPQVLPTNKDFITMVSDDHGLPHLNADHLMPLSGTLLNPLHYYGLFKLLDALQACTLYKKDCDSALGGGPAQRFMGKWSDGQPVKELLVTKTP